MIGFDAPRWDNDVPDDKQLQQLGQKLHFKKSKKKDRAHDNEITPTSTNSLEETDKQKSKKRKDSLNQIFEVHQSKERPPKKKKKNKPAVSNEIKSVNISNELLENLEAVSKKKKKKRKSKKDTSEDNQNSVARNNSIAFANNEKERSQQNSDNIVSAKDTKKKSHKIKPDLQKSIDSSPQNRHSKKRNASQSTEEEPKVKKGKGSSHQNTDNNKKSVSVSNTLSAVETKKKNKSRKRKPEPQKPLDSSPHDNAPKNKNASQPIEEEPKVKKVKLNQTPSETNFKSKNARKKEKKRQKLEQASGNHIIFQAEPELPKTEEITKPVSFPVKHKVANKQVLKLKKMLVENSIPVENPDNIVKLSDFSDEKKGKNTPNKSLRDRMMERLKSARFRYINEQIYTTNSHDADKYFKDDPEAFMAYHDGYRQQMKKWPLNPLDVIIKEVSSLPKDHVIADLGCGDGRLAKSVPHKVHSFDLISSDPLITACDMSHTPLLAAQVNVVVFCLSLMGTNLKDYIIEANRILKIGGLLKIADVESRFENVEEFIKNVQKYGFSKVKSDLNNNLFYFMDFKKESDIKKRNKLPQLTLNPCIYKKR